MVPIAMAIAVGLAGSGGFITGYLVRQPEINKLHKQVKQLQNKNSELRKILDEQKNLIEIKENELRTYKFINFIKKRRVRKSLRQDLLCQYASKEYLEIILEKDANRKNKEYKLSEEKEKFFDVMSKCIDNRADDEERKYLDQYIWSRYRKEIMSCQSWDYKELLKGA